MIALHNALTRMGHEVWVYGGFNPEIDTYEFIDWPCRPKEGVVDYPDLFIYNCYWDIVEPWGKKNWLYCLYPRQMWNTSHYDRILTLSRYSQEAIKERWGRDSDILIGGVYSDDWYPKGEKKNAILSCARFFMEGDVNTLQGHSKNQHILIEAFKQLDLPGWELWLAGSALLGSDWDYLDKCRQLAKGYPIRFFPMMDKHGLLALYQSAKIFWHAMGYGRVDPAEVEHYGYVALKARLCGLFTLTHRSGNRDLSHGFWESPDDLVDYMEKLARSPYAAWRPEPWIETEKDFIEELRRLL